MPSPVRRQRLLTFCAIVIVFMLYRVVQNSWDDSTTYEGLRTYDKPPGAVPPPPPPPHADFEPVERPPPAPPSDEDRLAKEYKDADYDLSSQTDKLDKGTSTSGSTHDTNDGTMKIPELDLEKPSSPKTKPQGVTSGKESSYKDLYDDEADATKSTGSSSSSKDASSPKQSPSSSKDNLDMHWKNPPNDETNKAILGDMTSVNTKTHWKKTPENFPLPSESIVPLPTGKPAKIPKIQAEFEPESETAKKTREDRLKRVKREIERSWTGYRKHAWGHDELKPVSGSYRDPFGHWGATLVDSLDTLWIAGFEAEFEAAVDAVRNIDFTWTPRNDIPVFETTIRYLGGLLSAYDVSGGAPGGYRVLLDKAVELGEILMGIFDTPNRMPILFYEWQPEFASQPHRAGRVGIAELATLSMEFTRLAQLTGENKYYDAIDRITNGLVDMQANGTRIPGLFPEAIDASGCAKKPITASSDVSKDAKAQLNDAKASKLDEPVGYAPAGKKPASSKVVSVDDDDVKPAAKAISEDDRVAKRDVAAAIDTADIPVVTPRTGASSSTSSTSSSKSTKGGPLAASGEEADWDCEPQGLVPATVGYQKFSMGGGQDSAYEYFPKEYLLLGGLEPKYRKLYEDAVDGIDNWLMFRPMSKDDWDVVFPAAVSFNGPTEEDKPIPEFEITHLTCFIGGMYALGGRAFGREADVETAARLTDGCVWAYQLMPSGLMPESAHVLPCESLDKCDFNQTLWYSHLDQSKAWRDKQVALYNEKNGVAGKTSSSAGKDSSSSGSSSSSSSSKTTLKKPSEALSDSVLTPADKTAGGDPDKLKEAQKLKLAAEEYVEDKVPSELNKRAAVLPPSSKEMDEAESEIPDSLKKKIGMETTAKEPSSKSSYQTDDYVSKDSKDASSSSSYKESSKSSYLDDDYSSKDTSSYKDSSKSSYLDDDYSSKDSSSSSSSKDASKSSYLDDDYSTKDSSSSSSYKDTSKDTTSTTSTTKDASKVKSVPDFIPPKRPDPDYDGDRPYTHEEYVEARIERLHLPPGWTDIERKNYLLRPEAIESVWYMYRVTGNSTWQDKGWAMFEATLRASRTELANSAITDVTDEVPELRDEMESFWIAETLKYYFLLFSEPDVISLDEWVLNTEAHPFRRPRAQVQPGAPAVPVNV